jgi:hypothetical protein
MTTGTADVLTTGDVSRMTGVPVSSLYDCAAKREQGVDSPRLFHCKLSSRHRRWMRAVAGEWHAAPRF